jgi:DNA-directed RNA polymerase specialized sigma24 family protein
MATSSLSPELLHRANTGDAAARETILTSYAPRILGVARRSLARHTQPWFDADDALQSVLRSAFRRWSVAGWEFATPDHLWAMLRLITRRKVWQRNRRKMAALTVAAGEPLATVADGSPPLDADLVLAEEIEALLSGLPADFARLLEWKMQPVPESNRDVARLLGVSPATVDRMMKLLKERLSRQWSDDGRSSGTQKS